MKLESRFNSCQCVSKFIPGTGAIFCKSPLKHSNSFNGFAHWPLSIQMKSITWPSKRTPKWKIPHHQGVTNYSATLRQDENSHSTGSSFPEWSISGCEHKISINLPPFHQTVELDLGNQVGRQMHQQQQDT